MPLQDIKTPEAVNANRSTGRISDNDIRSNTPQGTGGSLPGSQIEIKYKEEGYVYFPSEKITSSEDVAFAFREIHNS